MCVTTTATAVDDTVRDRQHDMKEIAAAAKAIAEMFKETETYSSSAFKLAATSISVRADQRLVDHFATMTVAEGSKATEAIAAEPDRFAALARDLKSYADALASAADRHPGAMSEDMRMKTGEPMGGGPLGTRVRNEATLSSMSAEHAFHLMLQTCSSCHVRFRSD
jgi:cytochrome c556